MAQIELSTNQLQSPTKNLAIETAPVIYRRQTSNIHRHGKTMARGPVAQAKETAKGRVEPYTKTCSDQNLQAKSNIQPILTIEKN